jgi:hypothetical protein
MAIQCRNGRYQVTQDTIEVLYYVFVPQLHHYVCRYCRKENRGRG